MVCMLLVGLNNKKQLRIDCCHRDLPTLECKNQITFFTYYFHLYMNVFFSVISNELLEMTVSYPSTYEGSLLKQVPKDSSSFTMLIKSKGGNK